MSVVSGILVGQLAVLEAVVVEKGEMRSSKRKGVIPLALTIVK